jgi:hypothetical protein
MVRVGPQRHRKTRGLKQKIYIIKENEIVLILYLLRYVHTFYIKNHPNQRISEMRQLCSNAGILTYFCLINYNSVRCPVGCIDHAACDSFMFQLFRYVYRLTFR